MDGKTVTIFETSIQGLHVCREKKVFCKTIVLQIPHEVSLQNTGDGRKQSCSISHIWKHQNASLVASAPCEANKYDLIRAKTAPQFYQGDAW